MISKNDLNSVGSTIAKVVSVLVDDKDSVRVTSVDVDGYTKFTIFCANRDMPLVIGRGGVGLDGIKDLLKRASGKYGHRMVLEQVRDIVEMGSPGGREQDFREPRASQQGLEPVVLVQEFMIETGLGVAQYVRGTVKSLRRFAGKDFPELRAYLLAQYSSILKPEVLAELRKGDNDE